jgi:parallel beta helix pectate lyase-like protein/calcineurin-like phosphoesterase family protein/purple acid phosphatase-like protein
MTSRYHGRQFLLAALALGVFAGAATAQQQPAAVFLTWSGDPASSVTVDWHMAARTDLPRLEIRGPGIQEWKSFNGQPVRFRFSTRTVRRATVTGLQSDALYELRIGASPVYRYRTMPKQLTRPIRFAAGGDTRAALTDFGRMNRVLASKDLDFVLIGGDLAYSNGDPRLVEREQMWWETLTKTLIRPDGRLIPALVAIGNHEVFSAREDTALAKVIAQHGVQLGESPWYAELFATPKNHKYGVVDFGDYLSVLLLNSAHTAPVAGEQTEWLERTLAERQHVPFIAPIYHVPSYPSVRAFEGRTSQQIREHWSPLFEKYGVRVVFENHDHVYKRTFPMKGGQRHPDGVVYMGDGAWGAGPRVVGRDQGEKPPWYLEQSRSAIHATLVTIDGKSQHMQVLDTLGNVIDEHRTTARPARSAGLRQVPGEYATLAAAVAAAQPGDTILLAPGVHRAGIELNNADLTIASRFLLTGDSSFIRTTILDGDSTEHVLRVQGTAARPLRIVGLTLQNAEDCIYAQGKFDFIRSVITRCTDGIDYDRGSGGLVQQSLFHNNSDDGLDFDGDVDIEVRGSVIRNNRQDGIEIRLQPYDGSHVTARIIGNEISGNGQDGIQLIDYDGISNRSYVLENNRLVGNKMAGIGCLERARYDREPGFTRAVARSRASTLGAHNCNGRQCHSRAGCRHGSESARCGRRPIEEPERHRRPR